MGLLDRLLDSRTRFAKDDPQAGQAKPEVKKVEESFFLDPDASSSLGDLSFMRRSNTIRRTFPGNADSPGGKEMVAEVASMEARLEKSSPGLAGIAPDEGPEVRLTAGVPKQVKKTFAQQMSPAQLVQRLKGSAVAVNQPTQSRAESAGSEDSTSRPTSTSTAKPGSTDPFRSMVKDITS